MQKNSPFAFSLGEEDQGNRHAYRAHVNGIQVRLGQSKERQDLVDISVTGCAFHLAQDACKTGDVLTLQLEVRGRVILAGMRAKVIRFIPGDIVACSFVQLSERQEYALDKLVLEIQKRLIGLSKM